jgi:outer membrane protein OmpA-like peptidoglycan-associated protein
MLDDGDDGARVGLWVTLGIVTLLLFGLIGGLAIRQAHKGAPAPAPATAAVAWAGMDDLIDAPLSGDLLGQLFFDVGSAALPADAGVALAAVKAALATAPAGARIVLSGFHDASGDAALNAELAKNRAKAVRSALVADGVDAARVGLRKPESTLGDGQAPEARRVEVRLVN